MQQTQQSSNVLRQTIIRYNRLIHSKKELEANCLLPIIKAACETLSMDYQVLLGIKTNYFVSPNDENSTERKMTKCQHCNYQTAYGQKGLQAHVGMKHKNQKSK